MGISVLPDFKVLVGLRGGGGRVCFQVFSDAWGCSRWEG